MPTILSIDDLVRASGILDHHRVAKVNQFEGGLLQGKIVKAISVVGKRSGNYSDNTTMQDITEFLGTNQLFYVPAAAGVAMEVVSTQAQDTSAGTGAQTVKIDYLTPTGAEATTTVTLNGTGAVSVAGGALIRRVQWMHAQTVGTGLVAAGNIICRKTSTNEPIEQITAGGNMSLSCRYTVPLGYSAYIEEWSASAGANAQDLRLRATVEKYTRALLPGVMLFQDEITLAAGAVAWGMSLPMLKYPALADIKVSTLTATTNSNKTSASIDLLLVQES